MKNDLSKEALSLYDAIAKEYAIDDAAGKHLLRTACEAFDRMRQCQASIAEHGEAVKDKFGQLKPHPLLSAERDSRAAMLNALKQLNLDLEPLKDVGRPSRPLGMTHAN